jgi:hypothetical protein
LRAISDLLHNQLCIERTETHIRIQTFMQSMLQECDTGLIAVV